MATTAAQLLVKISAEGAKETKDDLKGVSEATDKAGDHTHSLLDTMAGFVGGAAIVNLAGNAFDFLKGQVVDSFNAGITANQVLAQITAGLKSTHDASGETAQSLDQMAERMSDTTGITKSSVEAAQSMLLTFTNIGKGVFPQATQAVGDLATKMANGAVPSSIQMEQASIQLGKALGDPAKGYTALQRVGVTFTKQQVEQIKTMQKAGDIAGAQKIILGELNTEFGNSATAAGQANGGLAILQTQFENMKESLGQQLIPIMGQLLGLIQPIASALLGGLGGAISGITPFVSQMESAFKGLPLAQTAQLFQIVAGAAQGVGEQVESAALPVLKQLGTFFTDHLLPAVNDFASFAAAVLIPLFGDIATFLLTNVVPALLQLASFVTDTLLPAVEELIGWFRANVLPVLMTVVSVVAQNVLPVLEQLASIILNTVLPPIERIVGYILPVLIPAFQAIGWVISTVVGPVLGLLLTVLGFLLDKLADLVGLIATHVGPAFSAIGTWVHNALTALINLNSEFDHAGRDLIQGLINGITNMLGQAKQAISNVGSGILSTVKGLFGIHSPSSVFAEIGQHISQGLINGVTGVDVAGPIGRHLGGVVPSFSGSLGVGSGAGLVAPSSAALLSQQIAGAGGAASAGAGQPVILMLDGRAVARGLLPYTTSEIRRATGIRTM